MQPDHYETLGLPPASTPEQIKKRYRELARRYHPDVNPDPSAAQKIKAINEAYRVLGDPDLRSTYDAQRLLSRNQAETASYTGASRPGAPSNPPRAARPAASKGPHSWNGRAEYNGFGRTAPEDSPFHTEARTTPPRSATRKPAEPVEKVIERLTAEAQLAYINRRYPQAEDLCIQALHLNHRNPVLHEILGDVFVKQGDTERAQTAYTLAAQFNPRNRSVQTKLERLVRQPLHASSGPTMTRPSVRTRQSAGPFPEGVLHALSGVLAVVLVTTLFLYYRGLGGSDQFRGEGNSSLTLNLFVALLACGVSGGGLLALHGRMRPMAEELWSRGLDGDRPRYPFPLGVLLGAASLVWFYGSLLIYVGLAVSRNRFSPSILRVYGMTLLLTAFFAFLYNMSAETESSLLIVALAGNALFPAMLLGWRLGDAFRLRGRL